MNISHGIDARTQAKNPTCVIAIPRTCPDEFFAGLAANEHAARTGACSTHDMEKGLRAVRHPRPDVSSMAWANLDDTNNSDICDTFLLPHRQSTRRHCILHATTARIRQLGQFLGAEWW